jgi:hypothetical protein
LASAAARCKSSRLRSELCEEAISLSLVGDHDFLASLGSIDQIGKLSLLDENVFHEFAL